MIDVRDNSNVRFPVFLSSLCRAAPGLRDFRAQIYDDVGHQTLVYVDEQAKPRNVSCQDDLEASDDLIRRIREADTFVCILAGTSAGSAIKVGGIPSSTTFFEIELYQATLLRKAIHVLVRQDFKPDPPLKSLLTMLQGRFAAWTDLRPLSEEELRQEIERIVDQQTQPVFIRLPWWSAISKFVQALYEARSKGRTRPSVFFLNGAIDPSRAAPRVELIREVVKTLELQPNVERQLSRLWIGLHELTASDYRTLRDHELLKYWNLLLSAWASSGAWYSLHGDMYLGCLAALNSLVQVRERIGSLFGDTDQFGSTSYPGGALASAKYSIAKRMYVRQDRRSRFMEALDDVSRSIENPAAEKSGLLAIQGSIQRQLGQIAACIKSYEEVLRIRRERHAPANAIGEALSELGYAHLRQLHFRRGLRLCEEGVELMREEVRAGFLARGLRKLALAHSLNGNLRKAFETRREARNIAEDFGLRDQLR